MLRRVTGASPLARYVTLILSVYAALVAAGVHGSSIGQLSGTSPPESGVLFGLPRPIRSDEYLRSAPSQIGSRRFVDRTVESPDSVMITPLDAGYSGSGLGVVLSPSPSDTTSVRTLLAQVTNLDRELISHLPLIQEFTANWWKGTLYLFLGIAILFSGLGLSWKYSLAASLMIWFSPANQWWSLWPMEPFGTALLSVGLLNSAFRLGSTELNGKLRSEKFLHIARTLVLFALAASLGVRLPTSYQPWSVPIALVCVALLVGVVRSQSYSLGRLKWYLLSGGFVGIIAFVPVVLRLRRSLDSITSTVYPGERRFSGLHGYPRWGSVLNWELQRAASAAVNQSELAIGHVILIVPVIGVLAVGYRARNNKLFWPLVLGTGALSAFYLWTLATWPHWLSVGLFMDRFPPDRILQIVGVIVPLLYVLAVAFARSGGVDPRNQNVLSSTLFGMVFVLVLQDGSSVRGLLPWVSVPALWWTSIAAAVLVAWPFRRKFRRTSMIFLVASIMLSGMFVNPLMRGLGVLDKSESQTALKKAITLDDRRFAADSVVIDPVAVAAGMRTLSGNQGNGPNYAAYSLLDPPGLDVDKWNRAGSYVTFSWSKSNEIEFSNPSQDMVQIKIDPCNPVLDRFDLAWVASSGDQVGYPCLKLVTMFPFNGLTIRLYHRYPTD